MEESKKSNAELLKKLSESKNECDKYKDENKTLKGRIQDLEKMAAKKGDNADDLNKIRELEEQLANMMEELKGMRDGQNDLGSLRAEIDALQAKNDKLQQENLTLKKEMEAQKKSFEAKLRAAEDAARERSSSVKEEAPTQVEESHVESLHEEEVDVTKSSSTSVASRKSVKTASDIEWVFPFEHVFQSRTEQREVRVNGLSGYLFKESDDRFGRITERETGKSFKVEKVNKESESWVFVSEHPFGDNQQVKKRESYPVPDWIIPPAGNEHATSRSWLKKVVGNVSSFGTNGYPETDQPTALCNGWTFSGDETSGSVTYNGEDPGIPQGSSYKVVKKAMPSRAVYTAVEEFPLIDEKGENLSEVLVVEHVCTQQILGDSMRYNSIQDPSAQVLTVVDRDNSKCYFAVKHVCFRVSHKDQKINRLTKYLRSAREELESKDLYCKKLELAITELQSKFNEMKAALSKHGVKSNVVDAAMQDSGITNLLFGARSIRKVYERLYRDALDRLIRRENRTTKQWSNQQTELMNVLHLSYGGEEELPDHMQQQMYADFYNGNGGETFEMALRRRIRSNKIIQQAGGGPGSPKGSPVRNRLQSYDLEEGGARSQSRSRSPDKTRVRSISPAEARLQSMEGSPNMSLFTGAGLPGRPEVPTDLSSQSPYKTANPATPAGTKIAPQNAIINATSGQIMGQNPNHMVLSAHANKPVATGLSVKNILPDPINRSPSPEVLREQLRMKEAGKKPQEAIPQEVAKRNAYMGLTPNLHLEGVMNLQGQGLDITSMSMNYSQGGAASTQSGMGVTAFLGATGNLTMTGGTGGINTFPSGIAAGGHGKTPGQKQLMSHTGGAQTKSMTQFQKTDPSRGMGLAITNQARTDAGSSQQQTTTVTSLGARSDIVQNSHQQQLQNQMVQNFPNTNNALKKSANTVSNFVKGGPQPHNFMSNGMSQQSTMIPGTITTMGAPRTMANST